MKIQNYILFIATKKTTKDKNLKKILIKHCNYNIIFLNLSDFKLNYSYIFTQILLKIKTHSFLITKKKQQSSKNKSLFKKN